MNILFPADYFRTTQPDEAFAPQADAFRDCGYSVAVFSMEGIESGPKITLGHDSDEVLYRGWMLSGMEYERLQRAIESAGGRMFTDTRQYLSAHYLPGWYEKIKDLTPETIVLEKDADIESELRNLQWEKYFIKDFVKSLKTSGHSIIDSPEEVTELLARMEHYRDQIEGGICVRRVENFVAESERRFFVIEGNPYASNADSIIPDIVVECASRVDSRFFSIDWIMTGEGNERIVEIGDGQVSDIVGWSPLRLAEIWAEHRNYTN